MKTKQPKKPKNPKTVYGERREYSTSADQLRVGGGYWIRRKRIGGI